MTGDSEIYVKLLGENVEVWRPVQAEHLRDDIYLVLDQPYDRDSETWQFGPGSEVICKPVESSEGPILGATKLHSSD
jgi:hypothetical protein